MYYLLRGIQIDGEHEYRISTIGTADKLPTNAEAHSLLIEEHAFGYDPEDDNSPEDACFNYGDGLTFIKHTSTCEITESEFKVLVKLNQS